MQVTLKLYASLADYLPPGSRDNRVELDLPEDEKVAAVIARQQLPAKLVHLVLINGVFVPPEQRATKALQANDQLAIWPPIAGG
jgi:sulfur carrier protein ThiS